MIKNGPERVAGVNSRVRHNQRQLVLSHKGIQLLRTSALKKVSVTYTKVPGVYLKLTA